MKKQITKLSLNKKTISNLNASEMSRHVGGVSMSCYPQSKGNWCGNGEPQKTKNGKTCYGQSTCYTC